MVAQQTTEEDEESKMIRGKLTDMFNKYDKNRDGYLTKEEYNQWCMDTGRGVRMITTDIRYTAFCKVLCISFSRLYS